MDGKGEALKTFIEQTKLLVTLASGFLLAPAAAVSFMRPNPSSPHAQISISVFMWAEAMLLLSIVSGYVVLGTVAGSQHEEKFNVYRPATRVFSVIQLLLYLAGLCLFVRLISKAVA